MLDRAIFYKNAFTILSRLGKNYTQHPTNDECSRVEKIHNVLKPFYEITNLFSGTEYPTANLYFENVWKINLRLLEMLDCSDEDLKSMASQMKTKFDKYWVDYSPILSIAAVLDPRYKLDFVRFCYQKLGDEDKWVNVKDRMYQLFKEYDKSASSSGFGGQNTSSRSIHREFDDDINDFNNYTCQDYTRKSQLDLYLEEANEDHTVVIDVLSYWKRNQNRFPELSLMARDVLNIPITTVASESSFSMGGRVLSKWRGDVLPENAEALITSRSWLFDDAPEVVEGEEISIAVTHEGEEN